jgi:hypothetical protein
VLDAGTNGQDHLARRVSRVEVHHGPHPLRFGFAADCGDLFIGHGLLAPIADARGGEDLDHVAAFGFSLTNHLTQLCQSARLLSDLVNRRQQAWPGDRTGVDGVAHVLVNRRAEALNRRESGLDRGLEIAGLI